jgi:hypothetical protein
MNSFAIGGIPIVSQSSRNRRRRHMYAIAWLRMAAMLPIVVCLVPSPVGAEDDGPSRPAMVARIDELIEQRLAQSEWKAADRSDDAEFIRRVYLDLTGVVPRISEVRTFLADSASDKREQLIDRLLTSPAHATHLANTWRRIMLPGGLNLEQVNNVAGVQNWLRSRFVENLRYDNLVSELLVATEGDETGPALYYTALDLAPEKLAGSTARIFLGLQIECAQCHDHPFDAWKQTDFWGYAAFFAQLKQDSAMRGNRGMRIVDTDMGEVKLPNSDTVVPPRFIGREKPSDDELGTRRMQLAIWMASRDNPYLARAAVNRVWAQLFGRGIVEPVDDLGPHNPPGHPQLLDELTEYFVDTGFDLRELYATLTRTAAYQRTSRWSGEKEPPAELLAHMPLKTLTADQLYDSLNRILNRQVADMNGSSLLDPMRQAFVVRMQADGRSLLDYEAGVLQALTMLNGSDLAEATDPRRSPLLGAIEAPWLSDAERIDTLFLATLSRLPKEHEREACLERVAAVSPSEKGKAFGDVLWALLNSAEFALNH